MVTNNRIRRTASRRFVPCLEFLERRTLPSTFTVLNLADSGAGSLRQAVLDAETNPGADTITFANKVKGSIVLTSGELIITSDLAIEGPGADKLTVSGNDASRIFNIVGGTAATTAITVSISDLTITHGRADQGGGVNNQDFSDLTLNRVVLSGNRALGAPLGAGPYASGGAVMSSGTGSSLSVLDCRVVGNTADGLQNLRSAVGGGIAVELGINFTVRGSMFAGNSALGGTGGIASGGGINVLQATATIVDSTIEGNHALAGEGEFRTGAGGGLAIALGQLTIENTTIADNRVVAGATPSEQGSFGVGGGIDVENSTATINHSTIAGNEAVGGAGAIGGVGDGGGIRIRVGTLTINDSSIRDNRAVGGPGGSSLGGNANGGGILVVVDASLSLNYCTLTGNVARASDDSPYGGGSGSGGALALYFNSNATIDRSTLARNQAVGGDLGGQAVGGAIAAFIESPVSVSNSMLADNQAIAGSGGTSTGTDSSIATAFGGGISNDFRLEVRNSILRGNEAIGGNNAVADAPNEAEAGGADGGAIFNNTGGQAVLRDTIIEHNRAIGGNGNTANGPTAFAGTGVGGGINNQFDGNVYGLGSTQVTAIDCTIQDNDAIGGNGNQGAGNAPFIGAGLGGGIANYFGCVVDIDNGFVSHNRAIGGENNSSGGPLPASLGAGGAIFNALGNFEFVTGEVLAPSAVTVTNSTLEHNQAQGGNDSAGNGGDGWGGAIANLFAATTNITGSMLDHNVAIGGEVDGNPSGNGLGGAACNDASSSLRSGTSNVTENEADGGDVDHGGADGEGIGGGVYNLGNFDVDALTLIFGNHASTSNDDVFDAFA
jgi:hypothetical protein